MGSLSCGAACCRYFLITFNIIFTLLGIAFIVVGCLFRFNNSLTEDEIKPTLEDIEVGNGYNLYETLHALALIFIIVGIVVLVTGALGLCGACCKNRVGLGIYIFIIVVIFAAELAAVILFFIVRSDFEEGVKKGLKLEIDQANDNDTKAREGVEYLFNSFDCCKVDDKRLAPQTTKCLNDPAVGNTDCYDAMEDTVARYSSVFIGIGIAILAIEILCFIGAIAVCVGVSRSMEIV